MENDGKKSFYYETKWDELWSKENYGKKAFIMKPKHQYHLSKHGEHDCSTQAQKEWRLLWESKFDTFHEWTLIIRKVVDRKAFLANPRHPYHVSQCGDHDCSASNKKNRDYNE